jgi:signal transduction histidine kinase
VWDESFTEIADFMPVGVLVVDTEDHLVYANRLGLAFAGIDEAAVGRKGFSGIIRSEVLRKAIEVEGDRVVQMTIHDSGKSYAAEVRPLAEGAQPFRLVTLRDVTGIPHAHVLRRNFIFDLFHKIRTPLTTMVSVLSMMSSGQLDQVQYNVLEFTQMGVSEAVRLRSLLGRLRDLFLYESNSLEMEMELAPLPVAEALEEATGPFDKRTKSKHQTLVREFPGDEVRIVADPQFLPRALGHILYNAHVYTPEHGEIRVGARPENGHTTIFVADDGPGIPEEDIPKIFECFRRGTSAETSTVEGEGMGLFLARHLIHAQKGSLHLESVRGEGTRVEICLPLAGGAA